MYLIVFLFFIWVFIIWYLDSKLDVFYLSVASDVKEHLSHINVLIGSLLSFLEQILFDLIRDFE